MSIVNNAMVLNLAIGLWQGYRLDKDASRKVTDDANAEGDAARVNKHLIPKAALKDVSSLASAIRVHFYTNTLPWKDNGDRLLTRVLYTKFIEEHEELVGQFNTAVRKFLDTGYPAAVEQAAFRMGDLFKSEDYPRVSDLERRFYVQLDIDAVTEAGDFRVAMEKTQLDSIQSTMEQAMQKRIAGAMQSVWERLLKVVAHLHEKLADQDAVFRDSAVRNIEELVELLPGLNVLDDPNLERMRKEVEYSLTGLDLKDLRKDPAVRSAAAKEAEEIMESMGSYMRAFQHAET